MAVIEVKMIWIPSKRMWVMETLDETAIQEFFNCEKVKEYFEGLDKKRPQRYLISITKE